MSPVDGFRFDLAYFLCGAVPEDPDLYIMINADDERRDFTIQQDAPPGWRVVVDTWAPAGRDFYPTGSGPYREGGTRSVGPRSIVVLAR